MFEWLLFYLYGGAKFPPPCPWCSHLRSDWSWIPSIIPNAMFTPNSLGKSFKKLSNFVSGTWGQDAANCCFFFSLTLQFPTRVGILPLNLPGDRSSGCSESIVVRIAPPQVVTTWLNKRLLNYDSDFQWVVLGIVVLFSSDVNFINYCDISMS